MYLSKAYFGHGNLAVTDCRSTQGHEICKGRNATFKVSVKAQVSIFEVHSYLSDFNE